ncbi:hypothetical protein BH20ACI3_BH20ACI3_24950 [soil metagenome]
MKYGVRAERARTISCIMPTGKRARTDGWVAYGNVGELVVEQAGIGLDGLGKIPFVARAFHAGGFVVAGLVAGVNEDFDAVDAPL